MGISKNSFNTKYAERGHIVIHVLVALFGISAWIGINGIYVQLPVLINTSPEGWNLPAYIVLIIQSANIGPLLYTLLQYFQCKVNEPLCILCLLTLGTTAMGLLTFFHSETVAIAGGQYSVALFILTFFNALIGCFSSVLFMPYLRTFNKVYLISYFIGEGLSGVLPSIIALVQGIADNKECKTNANDTLASSALAPLFSPSQYFLSIFITLFLCLVAFVILQYSSFVQSTKSLCKPGDATAEISRSNCKLRNEIHIKNGSNTKHSVLQSKNTSDDAFYQQNVICLTMQTRNYLLLLLAVICFFSNGLFPSIQSYSCIPYGNLAYKLSITFAQFANPLACFLALWFITTNVKIMNCLAVICVIIGGYVTCLALMSPTPPLRESQVGVILVVSSWTILVGLVSYLKLLIVSIFRSIAATRILFIVGLIMQIGSASGAILSFVVINFTNYFKAYESCAVKNN